MSDHAASTLVRRHEGRVHLVGRGRARADENVCGDAFAWHVAADVATIVVVDGLGHGAAAHDAAVRAVAAFEEGPTAALDRIVQACHAALARTRGAALVVARADVVRSRLSFCGVGNVQLRDLQGKSGRGISLPGIVGLRLPPLRVFDSELTTTDRIVFHTDGVPAGFDPRGLHTLPIDDLAGAVIDRFGLAHDDATVVTLSLSVSSRRNDSSWT